MKLFTKVASILGLIGALAIASAQTAPVSEQQAAEAIKFRQADMDMQAYSLAPVLPMLDGARFDAAVMLKASSRLAVMMEMLRDVFETNTSVLPLKTNARNQIWSDPLAFELQIRDMQAAVANMASAATKGDQLATLKATRTVVNTCRTCHERFAVGLK